MTGYIGRRLLEGLVTLIALSFVVFGSVHLSGVRPVSSCPSRQNTTRVFTWSSGRDWAWTNLSLSSIGPF